jgi:hypothetical protein
MTLAELESRIAAELTLGRASAASNPGRARVCARRAAGWAIEAWYQAREGAAWRGDAMKQLNRLRADPAAPEAPRAAAERLSTKVDREHRLPFEEDALEDAGVIIKWALAASDEGRSTKDEKSDSASTD